MQLSNLNAWFLVVTIVAFVTGMAFYNHTESVNFNEASSAIEPFESGSESTGDSRSVFSLYKTPQAMPELQFLNPEKREITLDAFQGSVVLLNIWATWCVPCREEMPALNRLQAMLGGPDFEVVALSIDRGQPYIIEEFYRELELKSLAIYHDPTGSASYKLKVPGIPATLLINREGMGIGYVIGPREWDSPEIVNEIKSYLSRDKEEKIL